MPSQDDNELTADDLESNADGAPMDSSDGRQPDSGDTELGAIRAERDDLRDKLLRAQAECANISKRMTQQHQQSLQLAGVNLMRSMLPVLDNLDRTVDAVANHDADDPLVVGVKLVRQEFIKAMQDSGVAPIEAVGRPFDPMMHEAMMQDFQSDAAPGTVTQEMQRGYRMHDRVLRPAKVAVAAEKPGEPANDGGSDDADV